MSCVIKQLYLGFLRDDREFVQDGNELKFKVFLKTCFRFFPPKVSIVQPINFVIDGGEILQVES